jgi:hypothetical protein
MPTKNYNASKCNKEKTDIVFKQTQKDAIIHLIYECNLQRIQKNLRTILLDYIAAYKDTLPLDFDIQLYDFQLLFELLDILIEDSTEPRA